MRKDLLGVLVKSVNGDGKKICGGEQTRTSYYISGVKLLRGHGNSNTCIDRYHRDIVVSQ